MLKMFRRLPFYCLVLIVSMKPCWPELSLEPTIHTVVKYLNDSYIVTCTADEYDFVTGGTFKWLKNNESLFFKKYPYVDLKTTQNSSMLIFNRISSSDKGDYTCRYQDYSQTFKLIVVSQISFDQTPSLQTIKENREGYIKCLVEGDPQPKIMWKFKGEDLIPNTHAYEFLPGGLKILNVSIEDKGMYTCRALQVSSITSMYQEKEIYVNVQHKPLPKKLPVRAKVNQAYGFVGGMVNLTCEAIAEPAANFTWFRQHRKKIPGKIIEQPHSSILQIFIENSSMFGDYMCQAENSLGTLQQIITLSEGVQPPAPVKLVPRTAGEEYLELDLIPPKIDHTVYAPNMLPIGYRIQYRVKGTGRKWEDSMVAEFDDYTENDTSPYFLMALTPNTVYEIRAATRNPAGLSEYTVPRTIRTLKRPAQAVTSAAGTNGFSNIITMILILSSLLEHK